MSRIHPQNGAAAPSLVTPSWLWRGDCYRTLPLTHSCEMMEVSLGKVLSHCERQQRPPGCRLSNCNGKRKCRQRREVSSCTAANKQKVQSSVHTACQSFPTQISKIFARFVPREISCTLQGQSQTLCKVSQTQQKYQLFLCPVSAFPLCSFSIEIGQLLIFWNQGQ